MTANTASLINAILLILLGGWAYLSSENPSVTALIPVGFGILLAILNPGVKKQEKIQSHIAVVLTLLILFGLMKPLTGAIDRGDGTAITRVVVMITSTLLAMVFFIKSFIDARKARQSKES